jgi:hypothetical protein
MPSRFDHVSTETFHMIPDLIDLILFFYKFWVTFSISFSSPLGLFCIFLQYGMNERMVHPWTAA